MIEVIVQCGKIEKRFDTGRICCSRGWGQRLCEKELHMLPKGNFCGMGVGWACAWGASCRKACMLKRDKASAIAFCNPGKCLAETVKLPFAQIKNRVRKSDIMCGHFDVTERMQATTASLSHRKRTFIHCQWLPHVCAASMIGYSSLNWMLFIAPSTLEPATLKVCPEAYCTRAVSIQREVGRRAPMRLEEKTGTIPGGDKLCPPCQVLSKIVI